MTKRLVVKEFDRIVSAFSISGGIKDPVAEYIDAYGVYALNDEYFQRLKQRLLGKKRPSDLPSPASISITKRLGEVIEVKNWAGVINAGKDFQLEILPKIDFSSSQADPTKASISIFMRMLSYLKDFPGLPSEKSSLSTKHEDLFELFICLYLEKVKSLVRRGLKRGYSEVEENIHCLKGRLDMANHIKENSARRDRFYCIHDEYLPDGPENRLIKSSLLLLSKESNKASNIRDAASLLSYFENVPESKDYKVDYSLVSPDRNYSYYEEVVKWAYAFLMHRSFVFETGNDEVDSLLFPMEKVFESFIGRLFARCLRESNLYNHGYRISLQGYRTLFDDPKEFRIKPDIRIYKDDTSIIFDTKWKKLRKGDKHFGISQSDMYQMYAYAKRFHTNDVYLIYPKTEGFVGAGLQDYITITDACFQGGEDTNVKIHVRMVDLSCLADNSAKKAIKGVMDQLAAFLPRVSGP